MGLCAWAWRSWVITPAICPAGRLLHHGKLLVLLVKNQDS